MAEGEQSRPVLVRRKTISKDYYAGMVVVLLGLGVIVKAVGYEIGTLRHMGPGFFPAVVGILMVITGVVIAAQGTVHKNSVEIGGGPEWRGWSCIIGSIIAFIVLGTYAGLIAATFAVTFISALGDRENTFRGALLLSVTMCAAAVIVFRWLLQVQFPLFGPVGG